MSSNDRLGPDCQPLERAPRLGDILHSVECVRQAIVLSDTPIPGHNLKMASYPALIFHIPSGTRVLDASSTLTVYTDDIAHNNGWHIAEHYELGMHVPLPAPSILEQECQYDLGTLGWGDTCPCCGRTAYRCACSGYCDGDCEEPVNDDGDLCSACLDHTVCGCSCDCSNEVYEAGDTCGYCQDTGLCSNCQGSHDLNGDDLCSDCENTCRSCGLFAPGDLNDDYECSTCSPTCDGCLDTNVELNDDNLCAACAAADTAEREVELAAS